MNVEQKEYIERNIDLIESSEWTKFFEVAPDGIGEVLYDAGIDFMTQLGYVPNNAFCGSNIQTVVIADSVTSIGNSAFYGCTRLTSITIPNSVTHIGYYAFDGCTSLVSVTISNSVTSIGGSAFRSCGKLEIKYDGTKADWQHLIGNNSSVFPYTTYVCNCTDGIVKKSK